MYSLNGYDLCSTSVNYSSKQEIPETLGNVISDFFSLQSHSPLVDFTMKAFSIFTVSRTTDFHTAELVVFLIHLLPHRQVFWWSSQLGRHLKSHYRLAPGTVHSNPIPTEQNRIAREKTHSFPFQKGSEWKE